MELDRKYLKGLLESYLFVSSESLKVSAIAKSLDLDKVLVRELLDELVLDFADRDGGFKLYEIAGGYQFMTSETYAKDLQNVFKVKRRETLSRSNLETLSIIAYKQPITLSEIEEIRGVSSRQLLTTLLQKKLIKPVGQREVPGRPTLYGTTQEFLVHFGLSRLSDLPTPMEVKELRFEDLSTLKTDLGSEEELTHPRGARLENSESIPESILEKEESNG